MGMWEDLRRTPIDEIRRRAAIVGLWNDIEPVEILGAVRYAWTDGSGQSAEWFFTDGGQVLLLTFEHEGALNFYDSDYASQAEVFDGVPAGLMAFVRDQPENYEFLNVTDQATGDTLPHASGVFWFDGASWHIAAGLIGHCERNGIDLLEDGEFSHSVGFEYALSEFLLGREFTPESFVDDQIANGWYGKTGEKEQALGRLRAVFEAYGS